MLVSPILNDLLGATPYDIEVFLDEVDKASKACGNWSSRSSTHSFPVTSVIIRRAGRSYDVECLLGDGVWLTQVGDVGALRIPGLPDTVSMGMAGCRLGDVVAHSLLAREQYRILSSRTCPDGACAAYFSAQREELRF